MTNTRFTASLSVAAAIAAIAAVGFSAAHAEQPAIVSDAELNSQVQAQAADLNQAVAASLAGRIATIDAGRPSAQRFAAVETKPVIVRISYSNPKPFRVAALSAGASAE